MSAPFSKSTVRSLAWFMERLFGRVHEDDAHLASWISPGGRFMGRGAYHQQSAFEVLYTAGIPPNNMYEAVDIMVKDAGFVRIYPADDLVIDAPANITRDQIEAIEHSWYNFRFDGFDYEIGRRSFMSICGSTFEEWEEDIGIILRSR